MVIYEVVVSDFERQKVLLMCASGIFDVIKLIQERGLSGFNFKHRLIGRTSAFHKPTVLYESELTIPEFKHEGSLQMKVIEDEIRMVTEHQLREQSISL